MRKVFTLLLKMRMATTRELNPQSFKMLWKTKGAMENIEPLLLVIVKEYRKKTWKKQEKVTWKDIADRVFSEYVRLYYADDYGYVKCITSGVTLFWKDSQCWHFVSRWVLKYRYDIMNCHPQSYAENVMLSGNYKVYTLQMIKMYWIDQVEYMVNDKGTWSYNQKEYEDMIIDWYKFIVEKKKIIEENQERTARLVENWTTRE